MTQKDPTQAAGNATIKTLLVSDLVDSTKLVERLGDKRAFAIFGRHDRLARDLLQRFSGLEIDKTDGFLLLFDRPIDALAYAVAYHRGLDDLSREESTEIRSRVGIHLGEVYLRENPPADVARGAKPLEVEGLAKPMAARLMSLAEGNQTLLTQAAFDLSRRAAVGVTGDELELQWLAHGAYRFKGVEDPVRVFEAGQAGLAPLTAPRGSEKVKQVREDETVLGWRPAPGLDIPHRAKWRLVRRLGAGGFGEVWLGSHSKTNEQRVYKFCFDENRLRNLQREVTLFRLLKDALGTRQDIARIIDWNFDQAPYFVESEFTEGGSITDWAEQREKGITAMPLANRLELVAQVAAALAAAHSVGVLHKDLKPANILVAETSGGKLQAMLTDFGIGLVTDHDRLSNAGITMLGFDGTQLADDDLAMSGTQLYMAPEQLEGKLPTVQADIYALGVMLYQLVVGDLQRALAPGWERDVADELLREDIAALVDGSPELRLSDAGEAARRLRQLEERRRERAAQEQARADAEQARIDLKRAQKRRKAVVVAILLLTLFGAAMAAQSWRIAREAERAEREAETANKIADFVIDLFENAKPEKTRGAEPTVRDLVDQGAARLEDELTGQPEVRARITQMLGTVYFTLGSYDRAEQLFKQTISIHENNQQTDVTIATSLMNLAVAYLSQDRTDEACALLEQALRIKEQSLGSEHSEVADLLANLAVVYRRQGLYNKGLPLVERALTIYEQAYGPNDKHVAIVLLNLANLYADVGRYQNAETALARSLSLYEKIEGVDHPEVARVLTNLASVNGVLERPEEQQKLLRRALRIQEKVLGNDHPLVGRTMYMLGEALTDAGQLEEATTLLVDALNLVEKKLGPQHQAVADVLIALAEAERRQKRFDPAEQHCLRAKTIIEHAWGIDNPAAKDVLLVLGLLRRDTNNLNEAADLLFQSMEQNEASHGPEHPAVGVLCRELAFTRYEQGRIEDSKELMNRALTIYEQLLGSNHAKVVSIRQELQELSSPAPQS